MMNNIGESIPVTKKPGILSGNDLIKILAGGCMGFALCLIFAAIASRVDILPGGMDVIFVTVPGTIMCFGVLAISFTVARRRNKKLRLPILIGLVAAIAGFAVLSLSWFDMRNVMNQFLGSSTKGFKDSSGVSEIDGCFG